MSTVLVVDDEPNYLVVLSELLRDEGFEVFTAQDGVAAMDIVRQTDLDIVLTDMRMPRMDGLELLQQVKVYDRDLPVIVLTAYAEVEKAVAAMQAGASSYLAKPFSNEELVVSIAKAVEHHSLAREVRRLRSEVTPRSHFCGMVGKNQRMLQMYQLIEKVAPTPSSVLITGESGTGKELVARAIHSLSPRANKPFVAVNCAALAEGLLESELFGHERGAFTGAAGMRKGRFELANQGTVFLDEIAEMAPQLQAKLLRVLQEKTFERVGGERTIAVDVRLLAATNRDLRDEVEAGRFREDLYYRLNVIHLHLPPLRERRDDIPALVVAFVVKYCQRLGKPPLELSSEALRLLVSLPWEGNVRELENTIERAVILAGSRIEAEDVQPDSVDTGQRGGWEPTVDFDSIIPEQLSLADVLSTIEERMVRRALEKADQVQARAAEHLGITKSLLQYKMKKYNLQRRKK
ncbi:MAG: DNA-binding response regulator [Desulfobulbaceae bacterium A2]|nr:MAG: DNA-binding response regulator [Desulfobulbaceae bacterium A2]